MADTKKPTEQTGKSPVERVPSSLTKAVCVRAVSAFKHLVSAYAPAVLSKAQSEKDERDAMSAITATVASAAAEKASANPEIVDRMMERWVREELRKQENREAVAAAAIEHLADDPDVDDTPQPVDEDWLNLFGSFAEKATSESIQDIWSRVLAGEIRRPGTFSLITMQFVSLLDKKTAELVSSILPFVINNEWIPKDVSKEKTSLENIIYLEELGFLSGSSGMLSITLSAENHGKQIVSLGQSVLVIDNEKKSIQMPAYTLSIAGQQFLKIINEPIDIDYAIELFKKENPKTIELGTIIKKDEATERITLTGLTTKFKRPSK